MVASLCNHCCPFDSQRRPLIIPIYNQGSGVTNSRGGGSDRYDPEYGTIQAGGAGEASFYVMYPVDDIGGSYVGNGWAAFSSRRIVRFMRSSPWATNANLVGWP